jgi:hypothetical protein
MTTVGCTLSLVGAASGQSAAVAAPADEPHRKGSLAIGFAASAPRSESLS